jgi:hypothetical protein
VPTISHLVGIPTDTSADARLQPLRTRRRAIAALHVMNLATWKSDPFMLETMACPLSKISKPG